MSMEMPNTETKKSGEEMMLLKNERAKLKEELKRIGFEKGQGRRSDDQKVEDNLNRRETRARIKEIESIIKKQPREESVKKDEVKKEEVVEPEGIVTPIFDKERQPEIPEEETKTEPEPKIEQAPNLNAQEQEAQEPVPTPENQEIEEKKWEEFKEKFYEEGEKMIDKHSKEIKSGNFSSDIFLKHSIEELSKGLTRELEIALQESGIDSEDKNNQEKGREIFIAILTKVQEEVEKVKEESEKAKEEIKSLESLLEDVDHIDVIKEIIKKAGFNLKGFNYDSRVYPDKDNNLVKIEFTNRHKSDEPFSIIIDLKEGVIEDNEITDEIILKNLFRARGVLIDEKKEENNIKNNSKTFKEREDSKEKLRKIDMELWTVNSKMNRLYEKMAESDADKDKEIVKEVWEKVISKMKDRSFGYMPGMEGKDLASEKIAMSGGFKPEAEVSSPENQAEVKESFETRVTKIKKELFENAGNKSKEELIQLISDVEEIFDREKEKGKGKLKDKISEIRDGEHGKEKFVDGSVAYLPKDGEAIFIGDTHGDPDATVSVIEQEKFIEAMENGEKNKYLVFLGDYADRGSGDIENLEQIFALKKKYPDNVILMRGNHEEKDTGSRYGLSTSLANKYKEGGQELFDKYNKVFEKMPGVLVCGNGIVAAHGGIPSKEISSLKELNNEELLFQMRWNDPIRNKDSYNPTAPVEEGYSPNLSRDSSDSMGIKFFGKNVFDKFMKAIDGKVMVRAHEYGGLKLSFDGRLLTVFSTGGNGEKSGYDGNNNPFYAKFDLGKDIDKIIGNEKGNEAKKVSYIKPDYKIKEPNPENQAEVDKKFNEIRNYYTEKSEKIKRRYDNLSSDNKKTLLETLREEDILDSSILESFGLDPKNEEYQKRALEIQKEIYTKLADELENKQQPTPEGAPEIKEREELAGMTKHELNREIVMADEWLKKTRSKETTPEEKTEIEDQEDYLDLLVEMKEYSKAPESAREVIEDLKKKEAELIKEINNISEEHEDIVKRYNNGDKTLTPEEIEIAKGVNGLREKRIRKKFDLIAAMEVATTYMSHERGIILLKEARLAVDLLLGELKAELSMAELNFDRMVARKEIEPMRVVAVNRFAGAVTKTRAIETPTTPPASPEEGGQEKKGKGGIFNRLKRFVGAGKSEDEKKAEKDVKSQKSEINNLENELKQAAIKGISEEEKKKIQEKMDLAKKKLEELEAKKKEIIKKENEQEEPASEDYSKELDFIEGAKNIDNMGNILEKIIKGKNVTRFNENVPVNFNAGKYDDVINYSREEIEFINKADETKLSQKKKEVLVKFYEKVIEIAEGMKGGGEETGKPKVENPEPKVSRNKKPELKKEGENEGILDKYNLSDAYEIVKKMDENEIKKEWRAHPKLKIETSNKPVVIDEEVIKDYNELVVKKAIETGHEIPFYFVIDNEKNRVVNVLIGDGFSTGRVSWDLFSAKYKNGVAWRDAHECRKKTKNYNVEKYTVMFGHTHPSGYGPIFSHIKGPGNFGADYNATMSYKDNRWGDHTGCNFHIIGSPDMNLIGAIEAKEKGEIVYHPINVSAEEKAKEEKKEKGVKTVEIDEQTKEGIKKGLEKIKKDNEDFFWKIGGLINSFSKDERLFGDVFTKEWFDNYMKDIGIKYEEIEGIETKDFMAVVNVVYEDVKNEKNKQDPGGKPEGEAGGGEKDGNEPSLEAIKKSQENMIKNVDKHFKNAENGKIDGEETLKFSEYLKKVEDEFGSDFVRPIYDHIEKNYSGEKYDKIRGKMEAAVKEYEAKRDNKKSPEKETELTKKIRELGGTKEGLILDLLSGLAENDLEKIKKGIEEGIKKYTGVVARRAKLLPILEKEYPKEYEEHIKKVLSAEQIKILADATVGDTEKGIKLLSELRK